MTAGNTIQSTYRRDANFVPITTDGLTVTDIQTLVGNNTTVAVPIFSITGVVEIRAIFGVITTALGSNITAAYWRLNDATNQSNITVNTGTTLSAAPAGSNIVKNGLAAAALVLLSSSQERISEPTTLETTYFSPFIAVQKTGSVATNIEFVYTTTNTPTSGVIEFFVRFLPLSADGNVVGL